MYSVVRWTPRVLREKIYAEHERALHKKKMKFEEERKEEKEGGGFTQNQVLLRTE
jgi:hypothetical protein